MFEGEACVGKVTFRPKEKESTQRGGDEPGTTGSPSEGPMNTKSFSVQTRRNRHTCRWGTSDNRALEWDQLPGVWGHKFIIRSDEKESAHMLVDL